MATTSVAPRWSPMPFDFLSPGEVLALGIAMPLVCVVVSALRIYTRRVQRQDMKLDDWLIIPCTVLTCGMGAGLISGYALGVMGYPTPLPYGTDPTLAAYMFIESYEIEAKIEFAFQLLQCLAMGIVKLSVIYFCRRIFIVHGGSAMDWITRAFILLNVCWTIAFTLVLIFGCREKIWLHWAPLQTGLIAEYCGDLRTPLLASVISDFALELMILLLPLPSIWGLQVSVLKRFGITAVFLMGLMSVAASLVKMSIFIIVLTQPYDAGYDINQTVTAMLWWGMLQVGLATVAASLPTIYALRKHAGSSSFASFREKMNWSFTWISSSSTKTSSVIKDETVVRNRIDSEEPSASSRSDIRLAPVYFSTDGRLVSNEIP
ncbi:hypothetical protein HBI55_245860 [Parastagonospora nodorum]|nr:hypothetical protein HBI28_215930 [Parastagonospora nodorum]KAH5618589.1 hypothetical protein HBI22_233280 [Parastagonospora nodorum]KAH6084408.1 hypothetical protein HBI66_052010 [Parastagonospora nodorum]KAH6086607.1 hypothetical protein HBI67_016180 [Parastagonospora nodorum]KAH6481205.1 hypothetical protein HBI55_245860 [Parastagonospora nodorum]